MILINEIDVISILTQKFKTKFSLKFQIKKVLSDFGRELFDGDLERLIPHLEQTMELVPSLKTANIQNVINGPITYTPDGLPIIGPSEAPNFWLAVGFR